MALPAESSCCSGGEKEPKEPKPVKDKSKKADDKTKDGKGSGKPSPYQVSESENAEERRAVKRFVCR